MNNFEIAELQPNNPAICNIIKTLVSDDISTLTAELLQEIIRNIISINYPTHAFTNETIKGLTAILYLNVKDKLV